MRHLKQVEGQKRGKDIETSFVHLTTDKFQPDNRVWQVLMFTSVACKHDSPIYQHVLAGHRRTNDLDDAPHREAQDTEERSRTDTLLEDLAEVPISFLP